MSNRSYYRDTLTKGIALGALAGVFWLASRRYSGPIPALIDWERARMMAQLIERRVVSSSSRPDFHSRPG